MSLFLQKLISVLDDNDANTILSGDISGINIILEYINQNCEPPSSDEPYNPLSTLNYAVALDIFAYTDLHTDKLLSFKNDLTYMILAMNYYLALDPKLNKYAALFDKLGKSIYGSTEKYKELLQVAHALGSVEYFAFWKSNDPELKTEIENVEIPFEV